VAWAAQAPVLLAVVVNPQEGTQQNGLNYALFDCGLAVQNILLQASWVGLSAHPVNYYCRDAVQQILNLPETHELILFIAVGWPNCEATKTESSRLRKPLAAIATWDRWDGSPILE
jgi:nitroreductase